MDVREGMGLTRYRGDVVSAFQYALIIFTLTALIGIANAFQIFGTLDRNTLLTHLVVVGAYTEPVRYTAPVMGAAVLLGIGTYLSRLRAD